MPLTLRCVHQGLIEDLPLGDLAPGEAHPVRLRCVAGADAIHLALHEGGRCVGRYEVAATGGEILDLYIDKTSAGGAVVRSRYLPVLTLPQADRYEPPPPRPPAARPGRLDLAFLVDLTTRHYGPDGAVQGCLLAHRDAWEERISALLELAGQLLRAYGDVRGAVLGFGDEAPRHVDAGDLKPRHHLYPERDADRQLRPLQVAELRTQLLELPHSSGGDLVDALGDGLAMAERLPWRERSRRALVVFGDSPGHSILEPLPPGADHGVRLVDVDTAILRLVRNKEVEVLTIYHAPPPDSALNRRELAPLLGAVRRQYRHIASRPELAFDAGFFQPKDLFERLMASPPLVSRGPCLGEWVEPS